jgi:hypothetical protein
MFRVLLDILCRRLQRMASVSRKSTYFVPQFCLNDGNVVVLLFLPFCCCQLHVVFSNVSTRIISFLLYSSLFFVAQLLVFTNSSTAHAWIRSTMANNDDNHMPLLQEPAQNTETSEM